MSAIQTKVMLQRIGIIGDVHAEDELLESALKFLATRNLDAVLCVGDVVDGIGDANRCCELLREFDVRTVRGNHDRWILNNTMRQLDDATPREELTTENLEWLCSLSSTRYCATIAGDLLLCHGMGENDMQGVKADDEGYALECKNELQRLIRDEKTRFVIAGHTHRCIVRTFENTFGSLVVINAGTLFRQHEPRFAIVDFVRKFVQFHDFEDGELIPFCREIAF